MAQDSATGEKTREIGDKVQPVGKLVISSVITHAKLLDMIEERNPIIARRAKPKR